MLYEPGFSVKLAYNGNEGIEIYRRYWQNIDLVILDMIMPGLDGLQTFNALKEINPEIKAIILSGYTLNKKLSKPLKMEPKRFCRSPVQETNSYLILNLF